MVLLRACPTYHAPLRSQQPALLWRSSGRAALGLRRSTLCLAGKDKEPIRSVPTSVKEAPSIGGKSSADAEQDAPLRVSLNKPGVPSGGPDNSMQVAWRRLLKEFSSLPRAIAIMFAIAGLSGLGTIIPQNKPLDYYIQNYSDLPGQKVLGFLDYNLLLTLQLDHIYTAWYFYLSLGLLAASLSACTYTRQWPVVKVSQRWRFMKTPQGVVKMGNAEVLPNARLPDLGQALDSRGYQVFLKDKSLYAFKGLAGRFAPIGVHAALLLILVGTSYSGLGGFKGTVMCPEGGDFVIGSYMRPMSAISMLPRSAASLVHVDDFSIDYRPDGSVAQFYSTLTVKDDDGNAVTKTISVNDPLRYGGITMYQTDWSLAAVTLHVEDPTSAPSTSASATTTNNNQDQGTAPSSSAPSSTSSAPASTSASSVASTSLPQGPAPGSYPPGGQPFSLPFASLEGKPGVAGRLWASFLPLEPPGAGGAAPKGVSVLARDPQSVVIYDAKGQFVGVRRPGSGKPIEVEGIKLVVDDIVGSTGMEIKNDPGVPWVYAGFGGLMITTLVSYLSHSQVWALQDGSLVYVAGRSNRAVVGFEKELDEVLESVPELPVPEGGSA